VNLNLPTKFTSFNNPLYKADRSISFISDSDSICIQGLLVDDVSTLVENSFERLDIDQMSRRLAAARTSMFGKKRAHLYPRKFLAKLTLFRKNWRVLIANRIIEDLAGPASRADDFENMKKCFHIFADPMKLSLRGCDTPQTQSLM
jgi:hypothetical protein